MVSRRYYRLMAFTLRTDAELEAALDQLVEAQGVSRQESCGVP